MAPADAEGIDGDGKSGIGRLLRRAHRSYSRRLQEKVADFDLTLAQYLHLRELWSQDGIAQNELSQRIGIEKASSTAVLEAMERNGLIERVRNADDRRKVNVRLTPDGWALQDSVKPAARLVATRAVAGLSRPELDQLFRLLDRVIENVEAGGGRGSR